MSKIKFYWWVNLYFFGLGEDGKTYLWDRVNKKWTAMAQIQGSDYGQPTTLDIEPTSPVN